MLAGRGGYIGGEPYQRAFHVVKQTPPIADGRSVAGDKDIVTSGLSERGQQCSCRFPQAALGAVANHGAADLLGGGEADADDRVVVLAMSDLHHHGAMGAISAFGGRQKLGPPGHAFDVQQLGQG